MSTRYSSGDVIVVIPEGSLTRYTPSPASFSLKTFKSDVACFVGSAAMAMFIVFMMAVANAGTSSTIGIYSHNNHVLALAFQMKRIV